MLFSAAFRVLRIALLIAVIAAGCGPKAEQEPGTGDPAANGEARPAQGNGNNGKGGTGGNDESTRWPAMEKFNGKKPALETAVAPEKPEFKLGELVGVRVEVKNGSDKSMRCAEVVHDILSCYLEIEFEGRCFEYIRIQPEYFDSLFGKGDGGSYLPLLTLEPGDRAATVIRFIPPSCGAYKIRAIYRGLGPRCPYFFVSNWADMTVTPDGQATTIHALLHTDQGEIEIAFATQHALATSIHFLTLAHRQFYDRLLFHRVEKDRLIQAGDPSSKGTGNPGFFIPQEFNRLPHLEGAVSMARTPTHVDTAGSQFFITFSLNAYTQRALDGQYTVFAHVVRGMETARKIGDLEVDEAKRPTESARITKVSLVKR